tara:strand:- start:153 stop:842 length:690 start_codon:yes stop_codon:yes gene_type:complete
MPRNKCILLVDDDDELRGSLAEQLELHDEFATAHATSGTQAYEIAKNRYYDLVLLDMGLPDLDGHEVCRMMRKSGLSVPIIMLTRADNDSDTVLSLDAGANDCITKPFKLNVLIARMRAQLHQHDQSEDATFSIGPYTFKPNFQLLQHGETEQKVRLTEKETSILRYLYRAGNKLVHRDVMLSEIWGYSAGVTTHTLETHIYRLRQKIEEDPANAVLLLTEPGGYRLNP